MAIKETKLRNSCPSRDRDSLRSQNQELIPEPNMQQVQTVRLLFLGLLTLNLCSCFSNGDPCLDSNLGILNIENLHRHLYDMGKDINQRSITPWEYEVSFDLYRVPQRLENAKCIETHSCRNIDSTASLETIPVTLTVPVLRRNHLCNKVEFETINIACICATSRRVD
uniref:Uncharacterized protein n=1 Tax=Esox lucius TaxID=8010 RepID=A0A3P8Z5S4_ESOLU